MKKRILIYISWVFCIGFSSLGCTENEMSTYSAPQGINFARTYAAGVTNDEVGELSMTIDFTDSYYPVLDVKEVLVKIQGAPSDKDLTVALKVVPVPGDLTPKIKLASNTLTIKAGALWDTLFFQVSRPEMADSAYLANIVFDYENSSVVPGTIERQVFKLRVMDLFSISWEKLKITEQEWNDFLLPYIGAPGQMKIKLMLKATFTSMTDAVYYFKKNPTKWTTDLQNALNDFNKKNPTLAPLCEADGTVVVFEP